MKARGIFDDFSTFRRRQTQPNLKKQYPPIFLYSSNNLTHQYKYYMMQVQGDKFQPNQSLYTNSTIQIQSDSLSPEFTYHWHRSPPNPYHPLLNISSTPENCGLYVCSPLDYNCIIQLTVTSSSSQQHFRYGPIRLEKELVKKFESQKGRDKLPEYAALMQGKRGKQPVNIKLESSLIIISSNKNRLLFECEIIQSKYKPDIIKIFNQPNAYYLSIYLSNTDNANPGYLQLQFQDRLIRDQLICQIMEINGIMVKQLVKPKKKLNNSNNSLETPTLITSANFGRNSSAYTQPKQQKNIIKKSTFLRMGTIEKDMNELIQSEDETPPDEIIQDIYNILYTPTTSKNIESQKKFSKDEKDEQSPINNQLTKTLKHSEYLNLLTSCNSVVGNFNNDLTCRDKNSFGEEKGQKTMNMKTAIKTNRKSQNQLSAQINDLTPKSSLVFNEAADSNLREKIKTLTEINMQLFSENEKLKEENKFLKLNESKKSKIQYARIKEIRNIIANMASRIAYLEGFHAAKKKQSKEKEKIQTSLQKPKKEIFNGSPKNSNFFPTQQHKKYHQKQPTFDVQIDKNKFKKQSPIEIQNNNMKPLFTARKNMPQFIKNGPPSPFTQQKIETVRNDKSCAKVQHNPFTQKKSQKQIISQGNVNQVNRYYSPNYLYHKK